MHHTDFSTTEHYLGGSGERRTRDDSMRGRSFLVPSTSAKVIAISRGRLTSP